MAQFDVYNNPNTRTKKLYPYLLDVQNPYISDINTRIVIPIGKLALFNNEHLDLLTPVVTFDDQDLILLVPQIASVPAKTLGTKVGTLGQFRDDIVRAIDFAITGI